jgi:uncharacterized DUF497 family protein
MRITFNRQKWLRTLQERRLDMRRAKDVFTGPHFTRPDLREDYGEARFITVGWLDARLVVVAWTPRGTARRIISMRHCHEREAKAFYPFFPQ